MCSCVSLIRMALLDGLAWCLLTDVRVRARLAGAYVAGRRTELN